MTYLMVSISLVLHSGNEDEQWEKGWKCLWGDPFKEQVVKLPYEVRQSKQGVVYRGRSPLQGDPQSSPFLPLCALLTEMTMEWKPMLHDKHFG